MSVDAFGNVATDTVTGANMPSSPVNRETQLNWGTTGQFPTAVTDPSGAVTNWTYTSNQALTFGVPDSKIDANSLTTSWTYDGFGRKTKETRPDGTSTSWAWTLCTSYCGWSDSVYQIAQTAYQTNGTTAIRTDTNTYDPVDRLTQTAGPTVGGTTSTVQKLYNSLGLVTQQSMPFVSGTPYQQTFAYDVLNRPTSTTRPISSTNSNPQTTTYGYAGRVSTVTDPYGNAKTALTDVNGWLRQAKDAMGYTVTRAYDAAGSLTGITDSVGNTLLKNVAVVYGIKPFITAATDADRGGWTYTVDSLGERTGWTDAKAQSFSMTYDALSRPLSRTEPDLFTEWNYGSAAPNWGQLTSECTASAATTNLCTTTGSSWLYNDFRTYDSLARPYARTIVQSGNTGGNDGGGAFIYTTTYSSTTGLLDTLTYPKSTSSFALTLQYGYGYGLPQSVTDTSDSTTLCGTTCVLWTTTATNAFGEVTQATLGNGVVINRSYDPVTSWLTAATAGVGGGSTLLNQSYLEDENGNVIQRQDNNQGLTESFFYDNDYRLTCASLSGSCSTPTFVYDGGSAGPGDITTQAGIGTYSYPAVGQPRPHGVTSIAGTFNGITNPTFSYDANGNMTARASSSQNVYWSSYNYPSSISGTDATGSEEVQFQYGPDRQRWEQVYTGPSGTEQTYYVGKKLEVVFNGATDYRYYIYLGSQPIAIYHRISSGDLDMRYLIEDHQGGISVIAANTGVSDMGESFTAFGQRRSRTSWSGPPTTSDLNKIAGISRQGYTFQTWLGQSMGLNHMNGRVEDAILGRMLSPDSHIPDRTNAQSYNRYSYVNNNPVTMADPSGFVPGGICSGIGYCPSDIDHAGSGGVGSLSDGSFGGFTGNSGLGDFGYSGDGDSSLSDAQLQAIGNWSPLDGYSVGGDSSVGDMTGSTTSNTTSGGDSVPAAADGSPVAQSQGACGPCCGDGCGTTSPSQNGVMPAGECNPMCPDVTVSASRGSSSVDNVSTVAGWIGLAAGAGDPSSGGLSLGTNFRLYSAPRGNQYFSTLTKLSTVFRMYGAGAIIVGAAADYYNGSQTGSYFQASLNLGIGAAGYMLPPLAIPGAFYFVSSTNYPGGPEAYNQAFSDFTNATECCGP
jgi:RHS repeat-associated protein